MYFFVSLLKQIIEIREKSHIFIYFLENTSKFEIICLNYLNYFNHLNCFTSWNVLNRQESVLFQNFKEWVSPI